MRERDPIVYIMANRRNGTLYTGVTSDISQRVYEHKEAQLKGFTQKYACHRLVYFEECDDMLAAIGREKQIKAGSRQKKLALIEAMNPLWLDLYDTL